MYVGGKVDRRVAVCLYEQREEVELGGVGVMASRKTNFDQLYLLL